MRALHNTTKNSTVRQSRRTSVRHGRRFVSLLLCFFMTMSMLCNFGVCALSSAAEATGNVMNRIADGDTTDSYKGKLLSSDWGSRYAGRVWTDKSVFANSTPINLDTNTDGYTGNVNFNSDFGTVFSALSSSQRINEYPPSPIDLVILIDMSGSMASDIVDPEHTHNDYNQPNSQRISHSRIYAVLESINKTIKEVMEMGDADRVAVVAYGATAYTLMELGHYKTPTDGKYLEVKNFRCYYSHYSTDNHAPYTSGSASYMVGTVDGLQKLNDDGVTYTNYGRYARNDYKNGNFSCDPVGTRNIGYHTDLQAGIYQGFEELYKRYNSKEDVTKTYESQETGNKTVVQRIPVAIVMTDGGSNYALKPTSSATGDEWYNVPIYDNDVTDYGGAWKKYRTEASGVNHGGDATILDILMTASYEKSKVQKKYEKYVLEAKADKDNPLEEERFKGTDFRILTVSVDTPHDEWQKPRVYAALDPVHFFNDNPQANNEIDPNTWDQKRDVINAYNYFEQWQTATEPISISFNDSDSPTKTVRFNQLPAASKDTDVTKEDVINNINYNTRFADISSSALGDTFDNMLNEVRGLAFTPLSGDNASGVADSITYKDPLGEYMELKNGSITVDGSVTGSDKTTFDMSVLLYGEMHGMVRAGVYDYQWNDKYMSTHDVGVHGQTPFPMGWYKGDPEDAYQPASTTKDDSGSWPAKDPKTGITYATAEEAWADGWVMRFDFQTLLDFVPIANAPTGGLPQNLDESVKNTTYTCYRFADSQADRNKLRRNPIFGDVPESLQKEWDDYFNANGSYPVGMGQYSDYTGVYRLSDIRVWSEHTGDFIDQAGSITPEDQSGYDDLLYVNIPVSATPTQLAEITLGGEGPISYKDNLANKTQSTPFRLFYAVGLTEDLIIRDAEGDQTGVDVSKISGEYISTHSDPVTGNISFISNWYSNTLYRGYAENDYGYSTRGDAGVSFSPDAKNRYYLFQKPLPLIAHAYRVTNAAGDVAPVDNADGKNWGANGAGNGLTTWETVDGTPQSAASWVGGEFVGTYDSDASFKVALGKKTEKDGVSYIEDDKGYTYPLPADLTDAIITYTSDQLSKVDSDADGYTDDSNSFSSDDYFFLCIEYYMPMAGAGKDIYGKEDPGTQAVCKVYRMIARKGSAFGSGLQSANINNGDMLCWYDINGNCNLEIEYNSRTDTGDNTRGRPTLEKLTYTEDDLRTYLSGIGLRGEYLEADVAYWTGVQADPHMAALIEEIKKAPNPQQMFNELFDWSVAARTGGIRVGDMYNNVQPKGGSTEPETGSEEYYAGNKTHTANNFYVPTLSETSTAGAGLVINNYLGNNGRMEIANVNLMVTKTLVAPDGFTLSDDQQDVEFAYQVFEREMVGERLAQRLKWNPFSQSWQKRVESLDILTDNSSLLLDTNGKRALFCYQSGEPRQVVEVVEDGMTKYFYADESGAATDEECRECEESLDKLYYMYLPSNASGDSDLTYHLFGSRYEGYYDAENKYLGTTEQIDGAGTTAYYPAGTDTTDMADNEMQHFAEATDDRDPGSREYWTTEAELIPYSQVYNAEHPADSIDSGSAGIAVMALDAETGGTRWDHDTNHDDWGDHKQLEQFVLVTVIPDPKGIDSKVYSPFSSRTQYMTVPLYFGYKATLADHLKETGETFATCQHANTDDYKLAVADLYDQTVDVPTAVVQHTANFTLKSDEGLLLTGLGYEAAYRFTEKLTQTQIEQAYKLKDISHVLKDRTETIYAGDDDTGIYSVSGNTDYFTEQVNYTNTVDPELFVLIKDMVDREGNALAVAPDKEFTFTLTFEPTDSAAMTDMDSTLHYWKGKKDYTSAVEWTDADGNSYKMPTAAPKLDEYESYLTDLEYRLAPIEPDGGEGHTYTVHLKPNEAIVFYGLIAGTKFTVKETPDRKYPVVPDDTPVDGGYTKTGTIYRASVDSTEIDPETTHNRAEFTNRLETGALTVEKRIKDDEPDTTREFKFTVSLSPASGTELNPDDLEAVKYAADGKTDPDFKLQWNFDSEETVWKADVTLHHGEQLLIEGIPLDTVYTVKETQKDGYNLQHVASNRDDYPEDAEGNYLPLTGNSVTGEITTEKSQAYLLFVNEKAPFIPFSGGIGIGGIIFTGILLIGLAAMLAGFQMRRRRRERANGRTVL